MKKQSDAVAVMSRKAKVNYCSPQATIESYSVERGFASSGSFEGLSNSSNSYNDSNFT